MKLLKLTVLSSLFIALLVTALSCEKEAERKKVNVYTKSDLAMTGAQSAPVSNSSATGTLSVYYDKRTKKLDYTITWSGLSGNPTNMGIFGPAPAGYAALTPAGGLASSLWNISTSGQGASGSYSSSVLIDEVKLKEQTLLNYLYYVSIRTAAYPAGEIRAQIKFQ